MTSSLDAQLFNLLYGWLHQPPWGGLMKVVTHLGDPEVVAVLTLAGLAESIVPWGGKRPRLKLPWLGVGVAALVTKGLKEWLQRPRPFELLSSLGISQGSSGGSFPSGHAAGAFALAAVLSLRWPRLKGLFWSGAVLVALSRVALGEHWPSDVVAGALVGTGAVAGLAWIERKYRR